MKQLIILLPDEVVGELHKTADRLGKHMDVMLEELIFDFIEQSKEHEEVG